MQSAWENKLHVAIIMDGNGRWATQRGLPRPAGHKAGVEALQRITEAAVDLGIGTLTVYAFSADNWTRPKPEVSALMNLLQGYLSTEVNRLIKNDVRLTVIGQRNRLRIGIQERIARAETETMQCQSLNLRIALDYSARDAILQAAAAVKNMEEINRETFSQALGSTGDVDLLIRTGGEQRLSDFLLWECAYSEILFTDRYWPDFDANDLAAALAEFHSRERRFGGVPQPAPHLNGSVPKRPHIALARATA